MKKIILLILVLCVGVDAYAFGGGGGGGRVHQRYLHGVNSIGVHMDPDNPIVPPDFRDCNRNETALVGKCCPNNLVYNDNGVDKCCDETGHMIKAGECIVMAATVNLAQNGENYTFTWNQAGYVHGAAVERGAGSWVLYYDAGSNHSELHDFTLDSNGNLKEEVWYPGSLDEIENTPLKGSNTTSWLKELFGIKRAMAWVMNCSQGNVSYGYLYNGMCGGCIGGATPDGRGRCGFNTDEWKSITTMDKCVSEKGNWRFCACGGTLKKVNGNWTCICPDGGTGGGLGTDSICCKDGYAYDGTSYSIVDWMSISACGCPSGYTKLESEFATGNLCCAADGSSIGGITGAEANDPRCDGAPVGCAADEMEVDEAVGGCWKKCPTGATFIMPFCCKGGWGAFYNIEASTWREFNEKPIQCYDAGCPDDGTLMPGPTCCKNGKEYNPSTEVYDISNATCE